MNYYERLMHFDLEDPDQCRYWDSLGKGVTAVGIKLQGITNVIYDVEDGNIVAQVKDGKLETIAKSLLEEAVENKFPF